MWIIIIAIAIILITKGITKSNNIQLSGTLLFMSKVIVFGGCCTVAFQLLSKYVFIFETLSNISLVITVLIALCLFFKILFIDKK